MLTYVGMYSGCISEGCERVQEVAVRRSKQEAEVDGDKYRQRIVETVIEGCMWEVCIYIQWQLRDVNEYREWLL